MSSRSILLQLRMERKWNTQVLFCIAANLDGFFPLRIWLNLDCCIYAQKDDLMKIQLFWTRRPWLYCFVKWRLVGWRFLKHLTASTPLHRKHSYTWSIYSLFLFLFEVCIYSCMFCGGILSRATDSRIILQCFPNFSKISKCQNTYTIRERSAQADCQLSVFVGCRRDVISKIMSLIKA